MSCGEEILLGLGVIAIGAILVWLIWGIAHVHAEQSHWDKHFEELQEEARIRRLARDEALDVLKAHVRNQHGEKP